MLIAQITDLHIRPSGKKAYGLVDTEAMLRLSWEAYRNFVASAEAGYLTRSGDRVYDGEWLAFRLSYTF